MTVKFWQANDRFWFFDSYLIQGQHCSCPCLITTVWGEGAFKKSGKTIDTIYGWTPYRRRSSCHHASSTAAPPLLAIRRCRFWGPYRCRRHHRRATGAGGFLFNLGLFMWRNIFTVTMAACLVRLPCFVARLLSLHTQRPNIYDSKKRALLHFVAFFHVASLLSTRVENEKVGVDNEKALEESNSTVFHRIRQRKSSRAGQQNIFFIFQPNFNIEILPQNATKHPIA